MITQDSKRILIADDSEFFRVRLSDILTEAGHKTKVVNGGRGVIEELKKKIDFFDLLILDLQMPEVDGFEVLEWIKDNDLTGKIPVVVITSVYEPSKVFKQVKSLGATGIMTKALNTEQTVHTVNRFLFPDKVVQGEKRVPIAIPVEFTSAGSSYHSYLLNVSASGLFLHTVQKLEEGTIINLKFHLPDYDITIDVDGVVEWQTKLSEEENFFCGAGISFTNLSQEYQLLLRQFVQKEIDKFDMMVPRF
jgi:two-component system chemotaxis response regulator CheY